MIEIQALKQQIEEGTYKEPLLIMEYQDDSFLADTYWQQIVKGKPYVYASIEQVLAATTGFISSLDSTWKVCRNPERLSVQLALAVNTIIVCPIIKEQSIRDALDKWICTMPKVSKDHIRDWAYVMLEGVDQRYIDVLLELCKWDIRRISHEIKKFTVFPQQQRGDLFLEAVNDGLFRDMSCQTIFDFTNSVLKKNLKGVTSVYSEIESVDITEMYFYTVITNSFRNLCKVQLQSRATPENTGLSAKQIYALSQSLGKYSDMQLK